MRRHSFYFLVFGLALALPACTSLTEVDWSRIPPAASGGSGGTAGNGGNAGAATQGGTSGAGNTPGTGNESGSADDAGAPSAAGGADGTASNELAGAGGA